MKSKLYGGILLRSFHSTCSDIKCCQRKINEEKEGKMKFPKKISPEGNA